MMKMEMKLKMIAHRLKENIIHLAQNILETTNKC